jgi:hypothetical protein
MKELYGTEISREHLPTKAQLQRKPAVPKQAHVEYNAEGRRQIENQSTIFNGEKRYIKFLI